MRSIKLIFTSLIIVGSFVACNSSENKDNDGLSREEVKADSGADAEFLRDAAAMSLADIRYSEVAVTNATLDETKEMATMIVKDHKDSYSKISVLAESKGVAIPTSIDDGIQRKVENLAEKTGADFDKEYADIMVSGHNDAINRYERAAEKCEDPAVISLASSSLPTLREHLTHAEMCRDSAKEVK